MVEGRDDAHRVDVRGIARGANLRAAFRSLARLAGLHFVWRIHAPPSPAHTRRRSSRCGTAAGRFAGRRGRNHPPGNDASRCVRCRVREVRRAGAPHDAREQGRGGVVNPPDGPSVLFQNRGLPPTGSSRAGRCQSRPPSVPLRPMRVVETMFSSKHASVQ